MKDRKRAFAMHSIKDNLKSYFLSYVILLSSISVLEIFMLIRSLIFKNILENQTHLAYFVSYLTLLFFSVLTLTALVSNHKTGKCEKLVYSLVNVYGLVILLWSASVSFMDVQKGNTMIVFLTIIVCVAAVLNMHPVMYTALVVPLAVTLIVLAKKIDSPLVRSSGYYFNFIVFCLFSVILAFVQRRASQKTYAAKQSLQKLSFFDQLTGVYNRYYFYEQLPHVPGDGSVMVGIIDIDDFKDINDRFGHDAGDTCLILVSELLKKYFGERVYRFGGDEFVVVTDNDKNQVKDGIENINATLNQDFDGCGFHISAGFTPLVGENSVYTEEFKLADRALYRAKDDGKGRVCFNPD